MKRILAAVALALAGGCTLGPSDQPSAEALKRTQFTMPKPPQSFDLDSPYYSPPVEEITLPDGTRCAVLYTVRVGGISCGWKP